jgi:serine protease
MNTFVKFAVPASLAVLLAACGQSGTSTLPGGGVSSQSQAHQSMTQTQSESKLADGLQLGRVEMPIRGKQQAKRDLSGLLNWGGGAVQHSPTIYVVYWGWVDKANNKKADPNDLQPTLNKFLSSVGGSNWLSTVTQYYDKTGDINSPTGQFENASGKLACGTTKKALKGSNCIYDKTPPSSDPTDGEIQQEAAKLVKVFGANANASYVVQTPYGHNTNGFGTEWCAYHGAFTSGGVIIAYTNLPYMPEAGQSCGAGFVNNPGTLDGVTIVEGHELAETQTDPGANYSGWGGNDGEIGDICAWDSTTSNQPINGNTFPVQPLYSDVASACTLTGPNGP